MGSITPGEKNIHPSQAQHDHEHDRWNKDLPWYERAWHHGMLLKTVLFDKSDHGTYAQLTHAMLVEAHGMSKNTAISSIPAVSSFIHRAFKFEEEEEPKGKTLRDDVDLHSSWMEAIEIVKEVRAQGEGDRILENKIRRIFNVEPGVNIIGDTYQGQSINATYNQLKGKMTLNEGKESWDTLWRGGNPYTKPLHMSRVNTLAQILKQMFTSHILDPKIIAKGDTVDGVLRDYVVYSGEEWDEWESSVRGLSELEKKRSFRRWEARERTRGEFAKWREGRRGR